MPLLPTILSDLPFGKPQRTYLADLLPQLAGLPGRPTYRHLARFGARCPHTHSRQAARPCDFAALNLAGLCAVVPYAHELAWAGDSTFIPKSGRRLPGVGYRWHSGEGRVAWGQQYELLSVVDLKEHCSYPVHGCLQPASGPPLPPVGAPFPPARGPRWGRCCICWTGPWRSGIAPTSTSSWGTATTPASPWSRGWTNGTWSSSASCAATRPCLCPGPSRPRAGPAGRASTRGASTAPASASCPSSNCRTRAGGCTTHNCITSPSRNCCGWSSSWTLMTIPRRWPSPPPLFSTDPEMEPKRIYRIYRDRFQIEFNFRDAKQHLGLAACQARTADRHHFHLNAVLAALAWTRLELRHAAREALDRFSMANVKLRNFLEMVLQRLLEAVGPDRTLRKCPEVLQALLDLGQIEPKPT